MPMDTKIWVNRMHLLHSQLQCKLHSLLLSQLPSLLHYKHLSLSYNITIQNQFQPEKKEGPLILQPGLLSLLQIQIRLLLGINQGKCRSQLLSQSHSKLHNLLSSQSSSNQLLNLLQPLGHKQFFSQ